MLKKSMEELLKYLIIKMKGKLNEMAGLAKEIFKDYTEKNIILEAQIDNVNLFKKSNILEINLTSENKISIRDLFSFEMYLKKRFNLSGIKLNINYTKNIDFNLESEWEDIVKYVVYKYPSTKAILGNTKIEVQDKNITIYLTVKGKKILESRGINKVIERIIEVLYNKKCVVDFDETNQNEEEQIQYLKHLEEIAIEDAKKEIIEHKKEIIVEPLPIENKSNDEEEVETPLILGRSAKIKEELVPIRDITVDSGKIALQGEIVLGSTIDGDFVFVQSKELRNGKFLIMFNVYDGTSTITCKAFCEPDKAKKVVKRLNDAKGVKVSGTAQFDPYAKEVGIMSNIIIETRWNPQNSKTR